MKEDSEDVDNVSLKTSFHLNLSIGELVIWVEAINDEVEENNEWVEDDDGDDEGSAVLIVSPLCDGMVCCTSASCHEVREATE